MADATILSWITAEVDQALEDVRDSIARFSASPHDPAALSICPEHLHQVSGALRMVGLSGATRFCEAIEGSFSGANGSRPSTASIGIIDRAVLALKQFVDDVARGQANVPLRLFPVYRELAKLQGKADSSEKELFFPDLTPPAPSHPSPWTLAKNELAPHLQAQRARFQRGLLAWLRGSAAGLEDMRQALDALYQVSAQLPEPRALAWVAIGLIDGLLDAPEPDWQASAKVLCNKIDFHMRDLVAGSQAVNDPLLREMLYLVARAKPSTQRLKDIKLLYHLDSLIPSPEAAGQKMELDMDWLQPVLSDARSRLDALKTVWQQYVTGEPKSVLRFRELVSSFKTKAGELGNKHLIKLLDAIALVATRLSDPYPPKSQLMVIEMASAFLLAEGVLENFTRPRPTCSSRSASWAAGCSTPRKANRPASRPPGCAPISASRSARCSCARRWRRRSLPISSTWNRCSMPTRASWRCARRSAASTLTCGRSMARWPCCSSSAQPRSW